LAVARPPGPLARKEPELPSPSLPAGEAAAIHPSAVIAAGARLGAGVKIGPGAVIDDEVEIGAGSSIGPYAVIRRGVRMGSGNVVHPHAVLGGDPQDLTYDPSRRGEVLIGDDNILREGVTVSRPTRDGGTTRIGSRCFLMSNTHVGHDCTLGDRVIMASGSALGGHVQVQSAAFLGGGAMVHQFCRVGSLAMVGGLCAVVMDVLPFSMVGGARARHYRLNLVGLRRAGVAPESLRALSEAFRRLRTRLPIDDLPESPQMALLRRWLAEPSRRGIAAFAGRRVGAREGTDE
jgi:UDP-N-acetylglucosamine acyltransferase